MHSRQAVAVRVLECPAVVRVQILASIGQLEFFYDQAPMVMRSCSMALQLLSVCIGSYLSGALVYCVGRWCASGANCRSKCDWVTKASFPRFCNPARQPLMMWFWLEQVGGCSWRKAWVAAGELHSHSHMLASMLGW